MKKLFGKNYFEGKRAPFKILGNYEEKMKLFKNWQPVIKLLKEYRTSGDLLDVGCAYGHLLNAARNDFNVHGVDISEFAIKRAKQKFNLKNVKQGNVQERIPFNKKFDVITAIDVIEHLNNPVKALNNIYSKLKKQGLFIVELPTVNNFISRIINKFFYPDDTHIFIPSLDKFNDIITSIGFKKLGTTNRFLKVKNEFIIKSLCLVTEVFEK